MLYDRLIGNWDKVLRDIGDETQRERRINVMSWDDIHNMLADAIIFDIDNVAQYLEREIDIHRMPELLNIRPTFPLMWLEWKRRAPNKNMKVIWADGVARDGYSQRFRGIGSLLFKNKEDEESIEMGVITLSDTQEGDFCFEGLDVWECDLGGKLLKSYPLSAYYIKAMQSYPDRVLSPAYVPLLALTFMHCKNVILETISPPDRLQRARVKKGKHPLVTYRVLDVRPVKRILETEGKIREVGLKQALHICRGHFKDYTEKGLFGKRHGLYWWDNQVRGDITKGLALKDYRIHTN